MVIRLTKRILLGRKKKKKPGRVQETLDRPHKTDTTEVAKRPAASEWVPVLTASLRDCCTAPADELILHAFDLYCTDLHAPFRERQRKLAGLHSDISAGVAQLQALAPEMVQRAMARHRLEFDHFIEDKGDGEW